MHHALAGEHLPLARAYRTVSRTVQASRAALRRHAPHLFVTSMSEQPFTKLSRPRAYSSSGRNDLCDVNSPVTKWNPPIAIVQAGRES